MPKARLNDAMSGDDEAVRKGDDDSESGFGVVQAISGDAAEEVSSGCLQFDVTVRCRHVKTARTKLERSAAAAVIGGMELVPRRTAHRE